VSPVTQRRRHYHQQRRLHSAPSIDPRSHLPLTRKLGRSGRDFSFPREPFWHFQAPSPCFRRTSSLDGSDWIVSADAAPKTKTTNRDAQHTASQHTALPTPTHLRTNQPTNRPAPSAAQPHSSCKPNQQLRQPKNAPQPNIPDSLTTPKHAGSHTWSLSNNSSNSMQQVQSIVVVVSSHVTTRIKTNPQYRNQRHTPHATPSPRELSHIYLSPKTFPGHAQAFLLSLFDKRIVVDPQRQTGSRSRRRNKSHSRIHPHHHPKAVHARRYIC
jgi:hypothetical protein